MRIKQMVKRNWRVAGAQKIFFFFSGSLQKMEGWLENMREGSGLDWEVQARSGLSLQLFLRREPL